MDNNICDDDNKKIMIEILNSFVKNDEKYDNIKILIKLSNQIIDSSKNKSKDIINLILKRMEKGRETYGHGIIINDDLTKYGTESWDEMALEELLDAIIYLTASNILKKL